MKERIASFIDNNLDSETIFVLKGFSVELLEIPKINFDSIIQNKINRLLQITKERKPIVCFEEFICLYDLLILQYKQIYIIENPVYLYFYPTDLDITVEQSIRLTKHFDLDADENDYIGDLSEYINVYNNFYYTEDEYACSFNLDESLLKNQKIMRVKIESADVNLCEINNLTKEMEYCNICNDKDYYLLVRSLYKTDKVFAVTWENYLCGNDIIHKKLKILNGQFSQRVFAYLVPINGISCTRNNEIIKLMEKYWGYSSFRELKVYDLLEVEKKNKKVITISQERIINDLVEQVENCINGKRFKDIFVTASTGAGKSLMFQLPAIYLAEKYELMTLVITPLIGLMNDQVQALVNKGYTGARTINSDISPIIKQDILNEVSIGKCHILYLSPESLLSRSDIEQLIGTRKIGMVVIDEAHIVTTWGKQFRPDYWYLGDHVQKLRSSQAKRKDEPLPFIIATFTATAIYEGKEDMYHETLNSLHMIDPITYLGYVRRDNISIEISEVNVEKNKIQYEINKFDDLVEMINKGLIRNQKTLIYFPTVSLINRFFSYCYSKNMSEFVTKYHGQLKADEKDENFHQFLLGEKQVMLATKAFGMGIDIPDIHIIAHFAPTGNVCDYMQEIGRAARDNRIIGHAIYSHMSNDFKHINRLHGISAIQKYQLVEVIKKVLEIYENSRYKNIDKKFTKKRNEMLVDADSFSYIFANPSSDENDLINKVKTAMLLVQKDYENRGFAPFYMRPVPLFAYGYFAVSNKDKNEINKKYNNAATLIFAPLNIYEVNLKKIWEKSYSNQISFPKFKYLLYTKKAELSFNLQFNLKSAMLVEVFFEDNDEMRFLNTYNAIKDVVNLSIYKMKYLSKEEIINELSKNTKISRYKAESIISVFIAALDVYQKEYSTRMRASMYNTKLLKNGQITYQFQTVAREFFIWLEKEYKYIKLNTIDQKIYIINENTNNRCKEITTVLGILESIGVLRFKSLGGSNSQIYIYVNETKSMQIVRDKPNFYRNKLLELINMRHAESVKMLTYLFQNELTSDEVWEHLENYFLGILPESLLEKQLPITEDIIYDEVQIQLQVGENLKDDYPDWEKVSVLFENLEISEFEKFNIPLPDYYSSKLVIGDEEIELDLVWPNVKLAISNGDEKEKLREIIKNEGWKCVPMDRVDAKDILEWLKR